MVNGQWENIMWAKKLVLGQLNVALDSHSMGKAHKKCNNFCKETMPNSGFAYYSISSNAVLATRQRSVCTLHHTLDRSIKYPGKPMALNLRGLSEETPNCGMASRK